MERCWDLAGAQQAYATAVHRTVVRPNRAAGASTINSRLALEAARQDGCDLLLTDLAEQLGHFTGAVAPADRSRQIRANWAADLPE